MGKQVHGLRQFYLHHHRVGDLLGSLPHRERLGEYHASDLHQLYQFDASCALRYQLHQ